LHIVGFLHAAQKSAPGIDNVPILVMQGELDQIIEPKSTVHLFSKIGSKRKLLKTFPDAGHLLVTTHYLKDEVVVAVLDWLQAQLRQPLPPISLENH